MWAHTHRHKGTQQEEEEVLAKEVGDEWALSKQHLAQEVPIGNFYSEEGSVFGVCVSARENMRRRCGCNTVGPADFKTTTQ